MKALLLAALLIIAGSMWAGSAQAVEREMRCIDYADRPGECFFIEKGDVNYDGKTDVVDAMFVLQYTQGLREFTPAQVRLCNMNKDKKCTRRDAQLILEYDVSP